MQRILTTIVILASLAFSAHADFTHPRLPGTGTGVQDFLPAGWRVLAEAKGDLDEDGYADLIAVIERAEPIDHVPGCGRWRDSSSRPPRTLIVLIAERAGGYRMVAENRTIVLRADEGGVFGEPFYGISVERGAVVLRHYGGSAWRWANTYRFRLRDGGWFLIGYTEDTHHAISKQATQYDYNPLTDKVKITATGPDGEIGCYRCFKGERCPPSQDCEKDETRARSAETWKTLAKRRPITMQDTACVQILPFVPYQ